MKKFIFIILALLLISSNLFAKEKEVVNEYMNDVYFANGINTDRGEAQSALTDIIKKQVKENLFNGNEAKMKESVRFKLAYNNTMGVYLDMLEAWQQKKEEHGTFWWAVETFFDVYGKVAKLPAKYATKEAVETIILESLKASADKFIKDPLLEKAGLKDLVDLISDLKSNVTPKNAWKTLTDATVALEHYNEKVQLDSYKKSIEQGHSVIVVAHSQGNLFTNIAYDSLKNDAKTGWMTNYFYMVGVASPAESGTGPEEEGHKEIVTFSRYAVALRSAYTCIVECCC